MNQNLMSFYLNLLTYFKEFFLSALKSFISIILFFSALQDLKLIIIHIKKPLILNPKHFTFLFLLLHKINR